MSVDPTGLLFEEEPLVIRPTLARIVGLKEAIALQQLHYWTKRTEDPEGWVYNKISEWQEQFPFWSDKTIKRIWASLRKAGLVETKQGRTSDRTQFYRLDYEGLKRLAESRGHSVPKVGSGCPSQGVKLTPSLEVTETTQRTTPDPSGQDNALESQITAAFTCWLEVVHPGSKGHKLTKGRRQALAARLKEGRSPAELEAAIRGCAMTPHNMGENERKTPYNDLTLICRNGENVERFRDTYEAQVASRETVVSANDRKRRIREAQGLEVAR